MLCVPGSFAVSGIYIAKNACKFSPDEFSNHSDESDFTFIPDNDTASYTTYITDPTAMDNNTLDRSYDALGEPLNRTPLVSHQSSEPYSQGNVQV